MTDVDVIKAFKSQDLSSYPYDEVKRLVPYNQYKKQFEMLNMRKNLIK